MIDIQVITQILSYITIPIVFVIAMIFTVKFKFLQFIKLPQAFKYLFADKTSENKDLNSNKSISSFTALSAVLGGNLGTGNIAGIAVALTMGGPGSLFWMWVMAFMGAIIKFAGCYLGIKYRSIDKNGLFVGGPMYYMQKGLNNKCLATLFCIFTLFASVSVGNLVQVNSVAVPITLTGIPPIYIGLSLSILLGFVLFGSLQFFSYWISRIVPFMAFLYIFAGFIVLGFNYNLIIPSLIDIFVRAFSNNQTIVGGFTGYLITDAIMAGFARGLFATDAGIGIAPILHAEVDSRDSDIDPAMLQGLISIIAPIIVMIICMITGLVLMVTSAWQIKELESTNMCIKAFNDGLHTPYAGFLVLFTLFLFAFTTMMTWAHCGERAIGFLTSSKCFIYLYRIIFILIIPIGAYSTVNFVWGVADLALSLMLLTNLFAVFMLRNKIKV